MTKIVYNACFGGFNLSKTAMLRYAEIKGIELIIKEDEMMPSLLTHYYIAPYTDKHGPTLYDRDLNRTDPVLVQVVEELGPEASGRHSQLEIRELPPGTKYIIDEYDGFESVKTIDEFDWETA